VKEELEKWKKEKEKKKNEDVHDQGEQEARIQR